MRLRFISAWILIKDLFISTFSYPDEVAEWLRRWTANPMCSARVGSNPILVDTCTNFNQSNFFLRRKPFKYFEYIIRLIVLFAMEALWFKVIAFYFLNNPEEGQLNLQKSRFSNHLTSNEFLKTKSNF